MLIVCFEDAGVEKLRPATLARPAYRITCGSYQLIDLLSDLAENTSSRLQVRIRDHLRAIETANGGPQSVPETAAAKDHSVADTPTLYVNARIAPSIVTLDLLDQLATSSASTIIIDEQDGSVLVAKLSAQENAKWGESLLTNTDGLAVPNPSADPSLDSLRQVNTKIDVFRFPHDLVRIHMKTMPGLLEYRIKHGDYQQTDDGVFVADGVKLGKHYVADTSDGPIVLDSNVSVGPFCFFAGPVYVGPHSRVIEHSALKDAVALQHTVKIGGEVEASVIESYTNKQHHGFLGHSYLGSWINLGAGTCNSDLKNTYGKINVEYDNSKVATDMQFFGCVMGDYSKTAINTSIFTGKVIGVSSMMYGFVTTNVPSFVNYAKLFGQTSLLPADVMISTQARMFSRRKVEQREVDKQLLRDMYRLTENERAADGDLM